MSAAWVVVASIGSLKVRLMVVSVLTPVTPDAPSEFNETVGVREKAVRPVVKVVVVALAMCSPETLSVAPVPIVIVKNALVYRLELVSKTSCVEVGFQL